MRIGDQVGAGALAIATIEVRVVAATGQDLVAGPQAVTSETVGEHGAVDTVVHFALGHAIPVVATAAVVVHAPGGAGVLASGIAEKHAQITLEGARPGWQIVHQANEVLAVEVGQFAVIVLKQQVLAGLVVAPGEVEVIAVARRGAAAVGASDAQRPPIGGIASAGMRKQACGEGQVLDIAGSDLATLVGHRHQSGVVVHHHRQLGQQGAIAQFGSAPFRLGGQAQAAEFIHGAAIPLQREKAAGLSIDTRLASFSPAIEAYAEQAQRIDTEPDLPIGKARCIV
ncbi:hypothetical protein D3C80_546940 [compost metagenome]